MSFNDYNLLSEKSILKIRLIGQECEINYAGKIFSGCIRNETRNILEIMTNEGLKTIPKDQSTLRIRINNQLYEINGTKMRGRHEDRIKRRMKRKW
ncbi:MAG: ribonuclease P protein subunit [Candidatus Hodarchaeales archaeon]|jgi:RNase P/RNase MRP subunit p29